jgi:hypothetical protein
MGPTALLPLRRKACWWLFRPKNPMASAGCEPANLGTKGQHATSRPPKPLKYTMLMWSVAETIHTYVHESTLFCSYIQRHREGIAARWDRRLCPIAAVYLNNIITHTSIENGRNHTVKNRYKMSASIHPINTATVASTVSNLVTRVKMISRQPMVRVITRAVICMHLHIFPC